MATLNLTWTPPAGTAVRHYDVYQDGQWIGRAFAPAFWVEAATAQGSGITFGIAVADVYAQFQPPSAMATVTLTVPPQGSAR